MAGAAGLEPESTVLETVILPVTLRSCIHLTYTNDYLFSYQITYTYIALGNTSPGPATTYLCSQAILMTACL